MIDTPGIYAMSAQEYHSDPVILPSLSASVASILLTQSPRHAALAHPRLSLAYQPDEDSRFDLGSAAHALLLENDGSKVCVIEAADWRTKDAKAKRDEARANGLFPILAKHNFAVTAMVKAAREFVETTELAGIFTRGKPEQTIVWQEGTSWCRARLDWLTDDHSLILDYKSTESAQPEQVIRQIGRMGYDIQSEFYRRGLAAVRSGKVDLPAFVFLFQEITPPYACSLVALSNAYVEIGQRKIADAIDRWQQCLQLGQWPGYSTAIHYAEPAAWQIAEIEAQLKQENW